MKQKSYAELKEELQTLLDWFESSEIDVDKALIKYEEAKRIIEEMERYLEASKQRVIKKTT